MILRDHASVLERLATWQVWWWDVHLIQQGCGDRVTNLDQVATLDACARRHSSEAVLAYVKDIGAASQQLTQNVSPRLALENLILASPSLT